MPRQRSSSFYKLPVVKQRELLARYEAEGDAAALADEYGLRSKWDLYRAANEQGVRVSAEAKRRKRKEFSPKVIEALECYARGEGNARAIGASVAMTPENFRRLASNLGYRAPKPHHSGRPRALSGKRLCEFRECYASGDDIDALVSDFGLTSRDAAYRLAKREGVRRPASGEGGPR